MGVLLAAAAVALSSVDPSSAQSAPPAGKTFSIVDSGAVADGKTVNTVAIQKTIDLAASSGGGTLVVPQGTFLTGAIFLKPGVEVHLDGVLKSTAKLEDFPSLMTRIEGHFQIYRPAVLNASGCDHLRIDGDGTLDGSGAPFWAEFRARRQANPKTTNLDVERPRMMFIEKCNDVHITGIHLLNSGFWNLHMYHCDGGVIDGVNILAGAGSPSTDGMDIDSCQNLTIQNCTFSVNDDCIALKGSKGPLAMDDKDSPPDEHIHVTGCTFVQGPDCVDCGSEATIVRDVEVDHCTVKSTVSRGFAVLRLKMRTDTPQLYENIRVHDITMEGTGTVIGMAPWTQFFDLQGHAPPSRTAQDVTISDVHGSCTSLGSIGPGKGDTVRNFTFENIDLKVSGAAPRMPKFEGLVFKNVKLNGVEYTGPAASTQPAGAPTQGN